MHGTVLNAGGYQAKPPQTVESVVPHVARSFLGLIGKALRSNYEDVAKEPLPERWVELIHYLNERECAETERQQELRSRATH